MDIRKRFGMRIRTLRNSQGLSQEELAQKAELHRTYIGGIERGERNVSLINIEKLAIALDATVATLMRDF